MYIELANENSVKLLKDIPSIAGTFNFVIEIAKSNLKINS